MLKVFLVEDEFVMREGIKNNVDWADLGYDFCGEAGDGEVAFPMIQKLKPDIVITDIRMPFMDGLELSKLIKKEMPWIEIILLTGFEEFAYAKEAIKIGVAEYLSKPISGDELLKELDIVSARIQEKRKEREIREKYDKEMEELTLNNRKEFFLHLVSGDKSPAELHEMADNLSIDISAIWYNIILFQIRSNKENENEFSSSVLEAEEELRAFKDDKIALVFDRGLEGKALLFKGDSQEEVLKLQEEFVCKSKEVLSRYQTIRYFGGVGRAVNRLRELPDCFEQASRAFAHRYLMEENKIVDVGVDNQDDFLIENVNPKQVDRGRIMEFLKLGNQEETRFFVEGFFNGVGAEAMKSNIFRQYIVMDAYFCVGDFLESLQMSRDEILAPDFTPGALKDVDSAKEYMIAIIHKAVGMREQAAGDRYRGVVTQVMEYIEENYADEDLSLNLVASHVNFSPNHLSTIFSQQTNQTFIKYLTDFRMNKAKELLRCTGEKSSVISMKVGYKDPHYFSYLFKKTQGMTPTQYRGKKESKGE